MRGLAPHRRDSLDLLGGTVGEVAWVGCCRHACYERFALNDLVVIVVGGLGCLGFEWSCLDSNRLIEGNDGGACVSFDGGRSWSSILNQPTAQFYHVTADDRVPYNVYGPQQDNWAI